MRLAALLIVAACGGEQLTEHRASVPKSLPATLDADRPQKGDPRTVHVRVWADATVRGTAHWKEDINDQLDYASQLLTPMLGVKLAVDGIKDWDRSGEPAEALKALAAADKGDDVTWVIGYVAANDAARKAMSELGDAAPLGHHVIVRSWAERAETNALSAKIFDLQGPQKAEVVGAHRRHKQTVVLLHMLATTLGAIGETDASWIQHPVYSQKQSTFSDRNRELLQLALDARITGTTDAQLAPKLLEKIEKENWGGWIPTDHDAVIASLRNVVDAAKLGKTASDIPPAAYEQYSRIRELAKAGKPKDALIELDNLLAGYPGNATMHLLKCEILLGENPKVPGPTDAAKSACAHVSELAPGDPSPHFIVGEALIRAGDAAAARAELQKAEGKIGNLPMGASDAWRHLIGLYFGMGALTWTEAAIDKAGLANDPLAAQVAQTRARYGVPRGGKAVKPEDEATLVKAIRSSLDLIYSNKFGDAERAIVAAERKWPGAAGLLAARCDLTFRQGAVDNARAMCQRAVATDPDDSWALYLGGIIALRDTSAGGTKTGIAMLRKAIDKDPDLGQAWRALGKALGRAKDAKGLEELGAAYQAKFGQALPP